MGKLLIRLKRLLAPEKIKPDVGIQAGEPYINIPERKLYVGDGVSPLGFPVAEIFIGPHDQNLYVKIEELDKYIPIWMKTARVGGFVRTEYIEEKTPIRVDEMDQFKPKEPSNG